MTGRYLHLPPVAVEPVPPADRLDLAGMMSRWAQFAQAWREAHPGILEGLAELGRRHREAEALAQEEADRRQESSRVIWREILASRSAHHCPHSAGH